MSDWGGRMPWTGGVFEGVGVGLGLFADRESITTTTFTRLRS